MGRVLRGIASNIPPKMAWQIEFFQKACSVFVSCGRSGHTVLVGRCPAFATLLNNVVSVDQHNEATRLGEVIVPRAGYTASRGGGLSRVSAATAAVSPPLHPRGGNRRLKHNTTRSRGGDYHSTPLRSSGSAGRGGPLGRRTLCACVVTGTALRGRLKTSAAAGRQGKREGS